jgi:hypothetical protein
LLPKEFLRETSRVMEVQQIALNLVCPNGGIKDALKHQFNTLLEQT